MGKSRRQSRKQVQAQRIKWSWLRYAAKVLKARGIRTAANAGAKNLAITLAGKPMSLSQAWEYLERSYVAGERVPLSNRRFSDPFFSSKAWLELRYWALSKFGRVCMCCGSTDGPFHVDHIKPRSKYPALSLDKDNVQVLCKDCNFGKGNKDETDFRL